jgi:hypothetical protein
VPAEQTLGTQTVFQMLSGTLNGFAFHLLPTSSTSSIDSVFSVVSGSSNLFVEAPLAKGSFNHVCLTLNKDEGVHYLEFFKNSARVATSTNKTVFGDLGINGTNFLIGSGTTIILGATTRTPTQTLSASIDEFRVFHETRTVEQQLQYAAKSIYSTDELKLYYKFNEPERLSSNANEQVNAIVIDSSGNSLHSTITNFLTYAGLDATGSITSSLRQDAALDESSLMIYEKDETVPVLFPGYLDVIDLNVELLASATVYDAANMNLITRLVPQHYLLDGALFDGFSEPGGDGGNAYGGEGIPGEGQLGDVQVVLSLLYIWAKFFDEMKLYADSFSTLRTVTYDRYDSAPDNFLHDLVKHYGFNLPPMFNDSTVEQYSLAENVDKEISTNEHSLKYVQNEILRRVLINIPDVIRSKGTQHSIKSFLRAVGIDPDNSLRIREFGGPTVKQLDNSRESKRDIGSMVEFITSSLAVSPFLSASRIEVGYPTQAGTFTQQTLFPPHGISNNVDDGLLTSGSWSLEATYKYNPIQRSLMTSATQSLVRLCVTGTLSSSFGLIANLLVVSSSNDPKLMLYCRPGTTSSSPTLFMTMSLPNGAFFDSQKWSVSFGCERNDSIDSIVSSSYFLRVSNQAAGELENYISTSSFFNECPSGEDNVFRKKSTLSSSGSFLVVGQNQTISTGSYYLNDSTISTESRVTDFNGSVSNLRFWSKALSEDEWNEHVLNYRSAGVSEPSTNYNYVTSKTGSFERLRLETFVKQTELSASTDGSLTFIDLSENGFHFSGSGFTIDDKSIKPEIFDYSYISPYFDEASTNEKIRIRSFNKQSLIDSTPHASAAPVYELVKSEEPTDDARFSIDFSLVDALNRDIITMFSTLDSMNNSLGSPELLFSADYPDLEVLRDLYFNRIKEKLNFKAFFEFYRWFDMSIGTFIEQLVPRKTKFRGTHFTIESHMLERHKLQYQFVETYVRENNRPSLKDTIYLQLITGTARKY